MFGFSIVRTKKLEEIYEKCSVLSTQNRKLIKENTHYQYEAQNFKAIKNLVGEMYSGLKANESKLTKAELIKRYTEIVTELLK